MKKSVTMKDIAKELGVSIVTISKALSDKDGVSAELREKIKQVAQEMGYHSGGLAKTVKETNQYNVGILVAERFVRDDVSYYLKMYQKTVKALSGHGYYGILEIVSHTNETSLIKPNIIADGKVNGIIVLGQLEGSYIELIRESGIPFLFLDYVDADSEIDAVISDSFYGTYLLTDYLISLGHKKIGFVGTVNATSSILDRYMGYMRALIKHNLPVNDHWVINDRDEEGNFINFMLPKTMPTAFVCNCDEVAYLFANHLKEKGYHLPDDISIVGYDNYIFAELCSPKLTTLSIDLDVMTETAAKGIIEKIENPDVSLGRKMLTGKLIVRDSAKAL